MFRCTQVVCVLGGTPCPSASQPSAVAPLHRAPIPPAARPKPCTSLLLLQMEQRCIPGSRHALSSWISSVADLEQRVPFGLRALLPGCYHIMLRSTEEVGRFGLGPRVLSRLGYIAVPTKRGQLS